MDGENERDQLVAGGGRMMRSLVAEVHDFEGCPRNPDPNEGLNQQPEGTSSLTGRALADTAQPELVGRVSRAVGRGSEARRHP